MELFSECIEYRLINIPLSKSSQSMHGFFGKFVKIRYFQLHWIWELKLFLLFLYFMVESRNRFKKYLLLFEDNNKNGLDKFSTVQFSIS